MSLPNTEIIVLLRQLPGFRELLFDELELLVPLVEEIDYAPDINVSCTEGHSIVYKGKITLGEETYTRGMIIPQVETQDAPQTAKAREHSVVLHLSENRMHTLMRKEPELTLFVLEHLQKLDSESETSF